MTTPINTKTSLVKPVYTTAHDVLTDKRDYAAPTTAAPITPEALLRNRLTAFVAEWDAPEMSVYDDYDAALAALKEVRGETR